MVEGKDTSEVIQANVLDGFQLERVLNEDARNKSACLLGTFPGKEGKSEQAIIILEKTHFSPSFYSNLSGGSSSSSTSTSISRFASLGSNDVYFWLLGWMAVPNDEQSGLDAHIKLTIIRPATETHILKYTEQSKIMIRETPKMYETVVGPWIKSQPKERIQWVYNILEKKKESETILYEKQGEKDGFIILPDLKWDQKTLSSLYLVAIVQDRSLQSLRDLKVQHVPLLRTIMQEGQRVAHERFGLGEGDLIDGKSHLRCFIHYQPTYYHLHVHLLSSDYTSHPGALVGQAHLLEDVIDLLELGVDFTKRKLTYSLGSRSPLLELLNKSS